MSTPGESGGFEFDYCPADIKAALVLVEDSIKRGGLHPLDTMLDYVELLITERVAVSYAEIEAWLQEIDSCVQLIALPLDRYTLEPGERFIYPWETDETPQYTLQAVIRDDPATTGHLERLGVTPDENLERLRVTGRVNMPRGVPADYSVN